MNACEERLQLEGSPHHCWHPYRPKKGSDCDFCCFCHATKSVPGPATRSTTHGPHAKEAA